MQLRKNQKDAVDAFFRHFYDDGQTRGILSMCCGSGKTLTFYEIMKSCITNRKEKLFMYATPRILLVQDIVTDLVRWAYNDQIQLDVFIKVSDFDFNKFERELLEKSIPTDFIKNIKSNNTVRILTNETIGDVLALSYVKRQRNIVIITTYDSSKKIVNAISKYNTDEQDNEIVPDLLVLDEAHNLASGDTTKIANVLLEKSEDKMFNPSKYLFMTATPLKIIKRNVMSSYIDDVIKFSMNNEEIFGKIFYEFSFSKGILAKYIVDFDVIYLADTNVNHTKEIKKIHNAIKNLEKEDQQNIYFKSIAKLLFKQIKQYKFHHTIVYLSNQTKVKNVYEILKKYKTNEKIYYIISEQKKLERNNYLKQFKKHDGCPKILLSVDIFNEGIDVPICDSILFAEERNSETIIVQNIGRALRLCKEYAKTKAYVIIPTVLNFLGDYDDNPYSRGYKKIREVCDIMREDIPQPRLYERRAKGSVPAFKNVHDDDSIEYHSELVDEIATIKNASEYYNNAQKPIENKREKITDEKSDNIIKFLSSDIINGKIANIKFSEFKEYIQKNNITSLHTLSKFVKEKRILYKHPHENFGNEWICYGDLLFNKVYDYEEAIKIIKTLNINNFTTPKEWQIYYNNIIVDALNGKCNNDETLNKIIYIPYNPKTYYLDDWKTDDNDGWKTFLGKDLASTIGIEIKSNQPSTSSNAEKNLNNIINKDKQRIKKLLPLKWQDFGNYNTNLSKLKDYIDAEFEINSIFTVRFNLNKDMRYDGGIIWVKIIENNRCIPITIDYNYKIKYDIDVYDKNKIIKKDNITINRDKEKYIKNKELQSIIKALFDEVKLFVSMQDKK